MYAYVANRAGQMNEHYEGYDHKKDTSPVAKPREIAYWRKHPNLHGWMERLAREKGMVYESFNGVELELTWEDLDRLEHVVNEHQLPATTGFFFGDGADDIYKTQDLEFIKNARADLFLGLRVFYNSSW